jgi:hypothetical protein
MGTLPPAEVKTARIVSISLTLLAVFALQRAPRVVAKGGAHI